MLRRSTTTFFITSSSLSSTPILFSASSSSKKKVRKVTTTNKKSPKNQRIKTTSSMQQQNHPQFSDQFCFPPTNCNNTSTCGIIHWFRKGLRLHDNPAMMSALVDAQQEIMNTTNKKKNFFFIPLFIIDPNFADPEKVGINRYRFLLESLEDLDNSLKNGKENMNCRLFVARGNPMDVLPKLCKMWNVEKVTWEYDTEPYAKIRDERMKELLTPLSVSVETYVSHTLYDPKRLLEVNPSSCAPLPTTVYANFVKMTEQLGAPPQSANEKDEALDLIKEINNGGKIPAGNNNKNFLKQTTKQLLLTSNVFNVPTLEEMGYFENQFDTERKFPGGETEALRRLEEKVSNRPQWVRSFSKPDTSPNSLEPSTTVLSPYLKFGCLSPRLMYHKLVAIERQGQQQRPPSVSTKPPVSLRGQMLWREFNYFSSFATPNFHSMEGNPNCRNINWERDAEKIAAWKEGRTGFPFIDAIMNQLRREGWMHHLARHAVACFLTRGDLWQHWEEGAKVFDLYLLDADYAINTSNWLWLSASCFFYQYFRVYSPITFGKKTDPNGDFIRKYVPALRRYPAKYIYEPWTAPMNVQRECGCIIGTDYPQPIIRDHTLVSKENMTKMAAAYEAHNNNHNNNQNQQNLVAGTRRNRQQ